MADDPHYEKGLQKAYRLLAVRARSEMELRARLKEKKFDQQVVDRIIARLYELNILDDEAFARQWARRLAVDRLTGNRRIEASLQQKGVSRLMCERVLEEIRQHLPERQAVRQILQKKLGGGKLQRRDIRGKRSLAQYLLGRGFTPDVIYEMIKEAEEGYRNDDGQSD